MSKGHEDGGGGGVFASLVASAAQLLAPNSLQFNEHEFERCVPPSIEILAGRNDQFV